jgi:hypothetical protein
MDRRLPWARVVGRWPDGTGFEKVLGGPGHPDMTTVDAMARLWLDVRRSGGSVALQAASPELEELIWLAGLAAQMGLAVDPGPATGTVAGEAAAVNSAAAEPRRSGVTRGSGEMGRQAEGGEERLDVEEGMDAGDPVA